MRSKGDEKMQEKILGAAPNFAELLQVLGKIEATAYAASA
jgi:hypothetical protein